MRATTGSAIAALEASEYSLLAKKSSVSHFVIPPNGKGSLCYVKKKHTLVRSAPYAKSAANKLAVVNSSALYIQIHTRTLTTGASGVPQF